MFSAELINRISEAKCAGVLTGAGISAESGVPTFRGENGLWKKYRPEDLANFQAFINNPQLVWEWYSFRRKLISEVKPNPGHYALVKMEQLFPEFTLITQNVDDLHKKAGNLNIIELHGNIMRSKCVQCNRQDETFQIKNPGDSMHCSCGGLMRPDVVWYGEMLPEGAIHSAFRVAETCDVFFSIGTSALVQPAASLPVVAKRAGAYVIEINTEPTVVSQHLDESLIGPSGELLPKLLDVVWNMAV
ncbi:NAD-dependent deacetylase [bacterium]